jgi:tRNA(Arg) A34 adenosine deaminase TadA
MSIDNEEFMRKAIQLSIKNIKLGGGPFGAVIVKDGKIISSGTNNVTLKNDPTAHAEIEAIRLASKRLKTFDLRGCEIYTSCEPCPMCLSAIYWANLKRIYFANTRSDAGRIKFRDDFIYNEIAKPVNKRKILTKQILRDEAITAFRLWSGNPFKTQY